MSTAVLSGGFDPIHSGHVRMILAARGSFDRVIVLVNTDEWLIRKKGYRMMSLEERMEIVGSFSGGEVRPAEDDDDTVRASLERICEEEEGLVHFLNGGDRVADNIPEMSLRSQYPNLEFGFCWGGTSKRNSSSKIFDGATLGSVERLWGSYTDHIRSESIVVKTLNIREGEGTSYQRHLRRGEFWYVSRGYVEVVYGVHKTKMMQGDAMHVLPGQWHSVRAVDGPAEIVEMQYGYCSEDDIERKEPQP